MRCYWRLLSIPYKDHVTNEEVRRKIQVEYTYGRIARPTHLFAPK